LAVAMSAARLVGRRPWHAGLAAFAGGLGLGESPVALVAVVGVATAGALLALRAPRLAAACGVLVLGGAALGDLRMAALDGPAAELRDSQPAHLRAHLLTLPQAGPFGSSAEVEVVQGRLRGARLLVRAPRWSPFPSRARVGTELVLEGRVRPLVPAHDASQSRDPPFDYAAYLRRRGVVGELFLDQAQVTGGRRGGVAGALDRMRERAERAVVAGVPGREAALLRGMVLGQDERIDQAIIEDWRDAGLAHLLAVSGQNVMLLAALALPLLVLAGFGLRLRMAAVAALIVVYVPLAGAGPSLQRAGVMGLAGIVAMSASRPASRWYALLLAATATLAWNPRAWADPGWQLSFAAVAGILTLGVPLQRALLRSAETLAAAGAAGAAGARSGGSAPGRAAGVAPPRGWLGAALRRALADGVAITVAATVATAPLLAHHFGSVPLAGLPANLLALPAVAPAMWLGMLKAALGQLDAVPADAAAAALGATAALPAGYLAAVAERFADVPGGQVGLPLGSATAVLAAYAAIAAAALGARVAARRLSPRATGWVGAWGAAPRSARRALAALLVAALALGAAAILAGPRPPDRLTVSFLDVGQGDATLIQHPDGTAVLFDAGPQEAAATRLLRRAGVDRLAAVVATHASRDHHGGLQAILDRYPVDLLLDGGDGTTDPSFRRLLRTAAARGIRRTQATAPLTLTLAQGDLRIRILSPPPRPPGPAPEDPNPRAVVAIVSSNGFDLLLSADAESDALLPLDLPNVDAIKVPHHGSSDPGLPAVLDRLDPEVAAIEVGPNTYGHPAPSTLAALRQAHVRTLRTDRDGTITLSPDRGRLHVDTER
jgi:competence protein ComEC